MRDDPTTQIDRPGAVIVRVNEIGTTVFVITAVLAAVFYTSVFRSVAAAVALLLFFTGIAAFLWSFWNAVQRSRGEQVAVTQLYMLAGGVAPSSVRTRMTVALLVQAVAGLGTALARPNTPDGRPGTSLALGVLVPIFGFGLNGLWAAYHGRYVERGTTTGTTTGTATGTTRAAAAGTDVRATGVPIDQNERHG